MNFDIGSLKVLREKTGAGMMDCRKALDQAQGEIEAAEVLIREWGLNEVEKRSQRKTSEGCVAFAQRDRRIALVALACETDFVARNEAFTGLAKTLAEHALDSGNVVNVGSDPELTADLGRRMKENIVMLGSGVLEAGPGEISDRYIHGDGKIGAAIKASVAVSWLGREDQARAVLHDLCLQVAAKKPLYVAAPDVPNELVEAKEVEFRDEVAQDPKLAGKPATMAQGIVAGKMRKYISEICLLEQRFIKEEKSTVSQYLRSFGSADEEILKVTGFLRLAIGDE